MKHLLILGAGGHGKVVADAAMASGDFSSISFLDDAFPDISEVSGWKVTGKPADINKQSSEFSAVVAFGDNILRSKWHDKLVEQNIEVATILHPGSVVAEGVKLGEGTVLMAGSVINTDSVVGKGCIINTGSTIDHDNQIGDFVHISPGTHLGGGVHIGAYTWIGIGSSVAHNISIGEKSTVGAGSVVLNNIKSCTTVGGCPAKELKS